MNYLEIINELNEEMYKEVGETDRVFYYSINGYVDVISFGEIDIWNSEMDDRVWIEEKNDYEPFMPFIKRTYNKEMDRLQLFKFPTSGERMKGKLWDVYLDNKDTSPWTEEEIDKLGKNI